MAYAALTIAFMRLIGFVQREQGDNNNGNEQNNKAATDLSGRPDWI